MATSSDDGIRPGASRPYMPKDPHTALNGFPAGLSYDTPASRRHDTDAAQGSIDTDRDRDIAETGAIRGTQ
ncbi:MAG TPA: hypothetical protein VFL98_01995 [Candidatus Paceibacterota bacterium]|nr:hypothetical protein [Candidatus Paceibacterota bacterium]